MVLKLQDMDAELKVDLLLRRQGQCFTENETQRTEGMQRNICNQAVLHFETSKAEE